MGCARARLRRRLLGVDRDHLRPLLLLGPSRLRHLLALRVVRRWPAVLRRGLRQPLLDGARQRLLAVDADEGVLARHVHLAMARDVAGLDCAAANLLAPRDVRAPEGVWPKAGEVATGVLRRLVDRLADARVP